MSLTVQIEGPPASNTHKLVQPFDTVSSWMVDYSVVTTVSMIDTLIYRGSVQLLSVSILLTVVTAVSSQPYNC